MQNVVICVLEVIWLYCFLPFVWIKILFIVTSGTCEHKADSVYRLKCHIDGIDVWEWDGDEVVAKFMNLILVLSLEFKATPVEKIY